MEHRDVADVGRRRSGSDPVDEHALADLERRDHRLRRDAVRLDQERLDPEGETQRYGDDDDELDEGVPALSAGAPHDLLVGTLGCLRLVVGRGIPAGLRIGLGLGVGRRPRSRRSRSVAAVSSVAVAACGLDGLLDRGLGGDALGVDGLGLGRGLGLELLGRRQWRGRGCRRGSSGPV